jgi:hypothetical protein
MNGSSTLAQFLRQDGAETSLSGRLIRQSGWGASAAARALATGWALKAAAGAGVRVAGGVWVGAAPLSLWGRRRSWVATTATATAIQIHYTYVYSGYVGLIAS